MFSGLKSFQYSSGTAATLNSAYAVLILPEVWPITILSQKGGSTTEPSSSHTLHTPSYVEVTAGTDRVYRLAKKLGVKTVFGTDTLFDAELAAKQGKVLTKLDR